MSFRLTPLAEADVEAIADYIAMHNPAAAVSLLEKFVRRWELLSGQPRSGAARDDLMPGLRHVVTGNYITFYRLRGDDVEILRVLHGRRDIAASDFEP